MPNYIRAYVPGGSYFFTVALLERHRRLLTEHIDVLREAFRSVRNQRPFRIDAVVILPEHLHCLWTLPPNDADFSIRWRLIKSSFARAMAPGERLSARRQVKQERGIWQRRFWEHAIRDQRDFDAHFDYIHYNPVKHGWVRRVADWPHSSFHRWVRLGLYPWDWAATLDVREWDLE
ncbi:REP-associated tyrosine transposase [Methylococcus mesophilus]|uniref:REP-associated tyrosine transposase n=1 Tax=Methylococcus mesophilus TaxID=2993564 RepID=UPI00224ACE22|nr:transposase [Methylococcus mesophilus]UZR30413.1 transposase [Methylococcus mesophilus]